MHRAAGEARRRRREGADVPLGIRMAVDGGAPPPQSRIHPARAQCSRGKGR